MSCKSCGSYSLYRDDVSGILGCTSCGVVQEFDNYDAQIYTRDGPTGTNIKVGTSGTGSALLYHDKKIYEAKKIIDDLTYKLNLTDLRPGEITNMIDKITDGGFGMGDWFPILVGACSYVVMRMDDKSLPLAEIASVLNCDVYELGRMISRVVDFLNLKLPELDLVTMFERVICNSKHFGLRELDRDKLEQMRKQGVFLLNCAVKWFLTTGRRPMPVAVAVMVFVAELNGVDVRMEDVAKEAHCVVRTCRSRYSELLAALVKVAQALPWGKDVNVKNILKNAPFVMSYMEMKSMEKKDEKRGEVECGGVDLGDVVKECLKKDVVYDIDGDGVESDDQNSDMDNRSELAITMFRGGDQIQLSLECLKMNYTNFVNEVNSRRFLGKSGEVHGKKRRRGFELGTCREWWNGKSELSRKLYLKKILEIDVGLETMAPSFINGCMMNERRRAKINSAKVRIDKIMHPPTVDTGDSDDACNSECQNTAKRRKGTPDGELDWEDLIIETLLLHQVKEEEIETGHYNTLLSLHVFNSGDT